MSSSLWMRNLNQRSKSLNNLLLIVYYKVLAIIFCINNYICMCVAYDGSYSEPEEDCSLWQMEIVWLLSDSSLGEGGLEGSSDSFSSK
jgi:hypothetical protein